MSVLNCPVWLTPFPTCQGCKHPLAAHPLHWPLQPKCAHYFAEDDNHYNTLWCPECFFFLNYFWWNISPYCIYSPLPPLRGQPSAKCHPRWQPILGLAVRCRLGRLLDSNAGLQLHNLVSLPMSHHCSQWAECYSNILHRVRNVRVQFPSSNHQSMKSKM